MTEPNNPGAVRRQPVIQRVVDLGVCDDCGQVHEYCKAHRSKHRTGGVLTPCRGKAMLGQLVCLVHGGRAPQAKAAAKRRMDRDKAVSEVGRLLADAEKLVGSMPGVAQLEHAIVTAGAMAQAYRWLLDRLPLDSTWRFEENVTNEGSKQRFVEIDVEGLTGPDQHGNLRLHPYEEGLRYWTRLHGELLRNAAVIGLEERRQAMDAEAVDRIGGAIVAMVQGLGRSIDDPDVVPVVDKALLAITGGETA